MGRKPRVRLFGRDARGGSVQHLLSLLRPLLGIVVLWALSRASARAVVLPIIVLACLSDWLDGRLARSRGTASGRGRLIDNLCDLVFLAAVFTGFALTQVWSDPLTGSATRYWQQANWLPLIAMGASFGAFFLRWAIASRLGRPLAPSARGRLAGVANYTLAVVGGAAVFPDVRLSPWLLEPTFVTTALLNVSAVTDNLGLTVSMVVAAVRQH